MNQHPIQNRLVFFLAALCIVGGIAGGTTLEYFMTKYATEEANK